MADWPVGLSTGCFYRTGICDCLAPIRDAGFGMIEICSFPAHLDYRDTPAVERVADRIRELNLEAYSLHAPFAESIDITSLDPGQRQSSLDEILRVAEAAARLQVRYLVIHPGPEKSGLPRGERLDRMENAAQVLDRVASRCRELGIALVLENMLPHLFTGHVRELLWLLGALERTDIGVCLDTGHAFLSGDLRTVAHKLSAHLWMLHASDTRGEFDDHLPPGEGAIRWEDLVEQLSDIGFRGAIILEVSGEGEPATILAGAQRARAYLRRLSIDVPRFGKRAGAVQPQIPPSG